MKKRCLLIGFAFVAALAISIVQQPMPIEERFIRIQAQESVPEFGEILKTEPVEVQAILLDYADDPVLLLKAKVAFLTYPQRARAIFTLYGDEPEFQEILLLYGESILLPIDYFLNNPVRSVSFMHFTATNMQRLQRLWQGHDTRADGVTPDVSELTPAMRGWYAVGFIRDEGHDFLGQFMLDQASVVRWIQTERMLEGVNAFFASGFRSLETSYRTNQEVAASEIGWATVDALVVVGAVKLLRLGRAAAASSSSAGLAGRSATFATRLGRAGRTGLQAGRYAKWPVVIGGAYMVVRHPGLVSDILAGVATVLGLPVRLLQVVGWTLILLPVVWFVSLMFRLLLRPCIRLLCALVFLLSRFERRLRKRRSASRATVDESVCVDERSPACIRGSP